MLVSSLRSLIVMFAASGTLLAALVLLQMSGAPSPALAANCDVAASAVSLDAEEARFLSLINEYRAANGRSALAASTNLNRAAAWSAQDLGENRYFSHYDSLGRSPSARALDCGYPSGAGENIAAGTFRDTAQEAFEAWRNSAGHNQNMLNGSYRMIGIGRAHVSGSPYGWYWVTNFGAVNDGTSGGGGSGGGTTNPPPNPAPVQAKAEMTSPAPGSTLPGSTATFQWSAGSGATQYFLYVGTSRGSNSIYAGSDGLGRSLTVSTLPANGADVYVRLWTRFSSGWQYTDYTYRAAAPAGGGGGVTAKAQLTSPTPDSTLEGATVDFAWTEGSGALQYFLYVGTSPGANNLGARSLGLDRSTTIDGLPTDGRDVYVRLWTRLATGWQYIDYAFVAASPEDAGDDGAGDDDGAGSGGTGDGGDTGGDDGDGGSGGDGGSAEAELTSPAPGSTLPGSDVTFSWSGADGALEYRLYIGTMRGASNLFSGSAGADESLTASDLPVGAYTAHVRLWTRTASGWDYSDYTYRAASQ